MFDTQVTVMSNGEPLRLTPEQVIPYDKRVTKARFERDDEEIEKIPARVIECRKYLHMKGYHDPVE